jgi:hypothetical protein
MNRVVVVAVVTVVVVVVASERPLSPLLSRG